MTEQEAQAWIVAQWGNERLTVLAQYVDLLIDGAMQQNLIAPSTVATVWSRHIVDSAQLVPLADAHLARGDWLDVGSGAGLPGVVATILQQRSVTMVEPRKRRAEFLQSVVRALGLNASVVATKVEAMERRAPFAIVSARAVAPLATLFDVAQKVTDANTLWLLPKGRAAQIEVEAARQTWQGMFHVEHSVTEADSLIVAAHGVVRR